MSRVRGHQRLLIGLVLPGIPGSGAAAGILNKGSARFGGDASWIHSV